MPEVAVPVLALPPGPGETFLLWITGLAGSTLEVAVLLDTVASGVAFTGPVEGALLEVEAASTLADPVDVEEVEGAVEALAAPVDGVLVDPVTVDEDVALGLLAVDAAPGLLEAERVTGTLTAAVDAVLADPDGGAFAAAEDATLEVVVLADPVDTVLVGATFTAAALAEDVVVLAEAVDTGTLLDVGGPADVALALFSALAGPL